MKLRRPLVFGTIVVGVSVLAGFAVRHTYYAGLWRFNYPAVGDFPVQGLDVSHHQGPIDWPAVPAGRFKFVYIKATEGGDFRDSRFHENWRGAQEAGLRVGAYHFFTLCRPGADQAQNFIDVVPVVDGALPPVADLEFGGNCSRRPPQNLIVNELRDFTDRLAAHYGTHPILYVTDEFFVHYIARSLFADYAMWARNLFGQPDPDLFPDWLIWQFANNGRVPGITGRVDLNAWRPATSD